MAFLFSSWLYVGQFYVPARVLGSEPPESNPLTQPSNRRVVPAADQLRCAVSTWKRPVSKQLQRRR